MASYTIAAIQEVTTAVVTVVAECASEESIAAMRHFYHDHGKKLWGNYGFKDAFNVQQKWYADTYLAIDQGPIICMIENYRSGLCWNWFMRNQDVRLTINKVMPGEPMPTPLVDGSGKNSTPVAVLPTTLFINGTTDK